MVAMANDAEFDLRGFEFAADTAVDAHVDEAGELELRLAWLEERVARAVNYQLANDPAVDQPLRGLYLSREQATGLIDDGAPYCFDAGYTPVILSPQLQAFADRAGLDEVDVDILVAALAPDLDPRFEKLFGYLHDDLTKRRATIGLVLRLCGRSLTSAADRARLSGSSPLVQQGLVVVEESERPYLTRSLKVPDHVTDALLGSDACERRLVPYLVEPVRIEGPAVDTVTQSLEGDVVLIHLTEGIGGGACHAAATALEDRRVPCLIIDVATAPAEELDIIVTSLLRDHALAGRAIILRPAEDLAKRAPRAFDTLVRGRAPVILVGSAPWHPLWTSIVPRSAVIEDIPHAEQAKIWRQALTGTAVEEQAVETVTLSFRLTPEQISRAARSAALSDARSDDGSLRPLDFHDLSAGARSQSASGLDHLARRVIPSVTWPDLILPVEPTQLLRELALRVRWRDQVLKQWELGRGWRGRGIAALFAGPSGTGKTTAAEVIAAEIGFDIHIVELSSVVDKYIGETEKKLEIIFTQAEQTNTVLLFDEADAIFGKRSEVKDARDRYANVEVSYLLQRMERFAGLAILTTNLGANLDDAFTRRLDMVIDFPRPDEEGRLALWRHELRPTVPVDDTVDLSFCARAFELTGGNIRNIVVTAAYLAAEAGRSMGMGDIIGAVQREYRKMGRLCLISEFGKYAHLLD